MNFNASLVLKTVLHWQRNIGNSIFQKLSIRQGWNGAPELNKLCLYFWKMKMVIIELFYVTVDKITMYAITL